MKHFIFCGIVALGMTIFWRVLPTCANTDHGESVSDHDSVLQRPADLPHDDIRNMSVKGATVCTLAAMKALAYPALFDKKAIFTETRYKLLALGGCRHMEGFPPAWDEQSEIRMQDDGEEMLLNIQPVIYTVQDARYENLTLLKRGYALCWKTSIDYGCF